jgi:hypothetical protein
MMNDYYLDYIIMNITTLIITLVVLLLICHLYTNTQTVEQFSIFNDPIGWIADQGTEVWNFIEHPLAFARDVAYNVYPNYTWITRYYDKRNDGIRANKGMPPLTSSPTDASKVNFDFGIKNKANSYFLNKSNWSTSLLNRVV